MEKKNHNRNSDIGEIKGRIDILIREVLPRIERRIASIARGLNNHLKHHEDLAEKKGDRLFKIIVIVLQILLSAMVSYLLFR